MKKMSFFSIFFFVAFVSGVAETSLMGLFSREEMVEMAGYGEHKLSTVLITGSVFCQPSFNSHGDHLLPPWPLPGVLVGISCNLSEKKRKSKTSHGITNEFGDFTIDLPSHLHSIPSLEKSCFLKLLKSPDQSEYVLTNRFNPLKLSSNSNGIRTYDAGVLRVIHRRSNPRPGR